MKILGLSSDFHDSSAALVIDGVLIAAAPEERFTRNKHDSHFPRFAIEFCLKAAGLKAEELDQVVFYERPVDKWIRVLESSVAAWPHSRAEFVESQSEWLGRKLWTRALISNHLKIPAQKISEIAHHQSHLVQAFAGSPFTSAAVLTIDAVGERDTAAMATMSWDQGQLKMQTHAHAQYPHSLGLFYSAMTAFLGFKPMNDECTLMALTAFGEPVYREPLRKILSLNEDGFWRIDQEYLQFDQFLSAPWSEKLIALLGPARVNDRPLNWNSTGDSNPSESDRHWANLAASVQAVFTEALLHSARHLRRVSGQTHLCFAGGAALNCVANTTLAREAGFSELFIPVEPGDGGASIGAAFAGAYLKGQAMGPAPAYSVFQGQDTEFDPEWLKDLDVEHTWEYQKHGQPIDDRLWKVETLDPKSLIQKMSELLRDDQAVAWMRGRFEVGPRALGHRSILFRADRPALRDRVSRHIKERAPYRPYALALTIEEVPRLLKDAPLKSESSPMRWMQLAVEVKPEAQAWVSAGLHVDGSTRPQVVLPGEDENFHWLLSEFKQHSGVAALINTSFNEAGYPLVTTPEEALHFFARTSLDAVVINNVLIQKVKP